MKICVYTVCKDEIQFLERWYNHLNEADYLCVLDTGSIDGTWEKLQELAQVDPRVIVDQKEINPWRFDIARNESMKLIPKDADLCLVLDIDEYLLEGWSKILEEFLIPENIQDNCIFGYLTKDYYTKKRWNMSTRRRMHLNLPGMVWKYHVHEHIFKNEESFIQENFESVKLPWDFCVIHTPAPKPRAESYRELTNQKISEYSDKISRWADLYSYLSTFIKTDTSAKNLYDTICTLLSTFSKRDAVYFKWLATKLTLMKFLNIVEVDKELDEYYKIDTWDYPRDPQLQCFKWLKWTKGLTEENKKEIELLIQNPPYNCPEYILMLKELLE